jgi:hypothetical protein
MAKTRDWERTFESWSTAPGTAQQRKAENAERAVRAAIDGSAELSAMEVRVFAQGSYRNRTNVRLESDVDICVCLMDKFTTRLDNGLTNSDVEIKDDPYTPADFKNSVEHALRTHFGADGVTRGKKAFDVHENTYRIDADVVPALEYRWYFRDGNGAIQRISGVAIFPDGGSRIENYPEQHYTNGVDKNSRTGRRYKDVVRVIKRLRNEMKDEGIQSAAKTPSFLIESLVWNAPDEGFDHDSYVDDIRYVLAHLFNESRSDDSCKAWLEVNGIKWLFHPTQSWSRQQAHSFVGDAWDYVGFK